MSEADMTYHPNMEADRRQAVAEQLRELAARIEAESDEDFSFGTVRGYISIPDPPFWRHELDGTQLIYLSLGTNQPWPLMDQALLSLSMKNAVKASKAGQR